MKVTIIGAGNMGRAIGTLAVSGGHDVDRDPADARALADELGGSAGGLAPGAPLGRHHESGRRGDLGQPRHAAGHLFG